MNECILVCSEFLNTIILLFSVVQSVKKQNDKKKPQNMKEIDRKIFYLFFPKNDFFRGNAFQ